jgi:CRP-like cAMP-binding protein
MTDAALLHIVAHAPLAPQLRLQAFRRKEFLPLIPDQVWQIEQGVVRVITWNEKGHVTTLGLWGRGDVVGQPLTRQRPCHCECLTAVKAITTPFGNHSRYWHTVLLKHLWYQEDLLRIIHQPSVLESLMQLLQWLAQRFGKALPQGHLLDPLLTHQQLAEILGTSRVTVTRALTQLEDEGRLIKFKKSSGQWTGDVQLSFSSRTLLIVKEA